LASLGVRFIAVSQGLDTDQSSPTSQLLLHIPAAVAQFERELIRERVAAGMANAKRSGVQFGRPRVVFDRQHVLDMRAEGRSLPEIARTLGVGYGAVARCVASLSK
jgi:DNA invertase Pin-like site-specific DNA recombinase